MDTENDGTIAAPEAAPAADTAQVANPSESTPEQQAGTETPESPDAGAETDKPKQVPWFQKRIDELTAKRYEEQRRADYLEGQLAALKPRAPEPEPAKPPTLDDHNWDEASYQRAVADYYSSVAETAARKVMQQSTAEQQQATQLHTAQARLEAGTRKYADFGEVIADIPVTDAVRELLINADNAAEVFYDIGKRPGEAARIFSLSPYLQAVELGKVAARLESPSASSPKPIPPAPPQTVAGLSAGLNKAPAEMSMAEYVAARTAGQI